MLKNIVLIYYSGTGNTKTVTIELAKLLEKEDYSVELINAEDIESLKKTDIKDKVIGLGFPIYGHDYPIIIMDNVLKYLDTNGNINPVFIFSTSWKTPGIGINHISKKLKKKNIYTIAKKEFLCPSNGWTCCTTYDSKKFKGMHFDENLFTSIKKFSQEVNSSITKFNDRPYSKISFINPLEKVLVKLSKNIEAKLWTDFKIDTNKCIKCHKCVNNCPVNNITVDDNKISFINTKSCLYCMRCISNCPADAITLGEATVGKGRYTKELRESLMKEQISDIPYDYWNK